MKLVRRNKEIARDVSPKALGEKAPLSEDSPPDLYRVPPQSSAWKVLVVDDEPDVHAVTRLSLKNFRFADRDIVLLNAMSGEAARELLENHADIAVALIDVVMETEDAGLRLVDFIREELRNRAMRLIIRTGQPGAAPERYVIDHYDIDDYKDKTELIEQKLYTTIRSAIKAYRDISIIDKNRQGLEKILNAAPHLYCLQPMQQFFEGVLTQIIGLCSLGKDNLISATTQGFLAISEGDSKIFIQVGTGRFEKNIDPSYLEAITRAFYFSENTLPENSMLIPLKIRNHRRGFIYIEDASFTNEEDRKLISIMANQCAAALENLNLYHDVEAARRVNERKNQFLGIAAHDLRNPLAGIRTLTDLLEASLSEHLDEDDANYFNLLKTLYHNAMTLISNLLDIAKIESGKLELETERTDIAAITRDALENNYFLTEAKNIRVIFEADEMIPDIMIDPFRFQQVVSNLISNAAKYSQPDTTVRVSLFQKHPNEILVTVQDEGQGIPKHEIGKLFQPFVKASVKSTGGEQSTGLGLVICKKIIEAHGGCIWLESEPGVGSTFYITLPVSETHSLSCVEK